MRTRICSYGRSDLESVSSRLRGFERIGREECKAGVSCATQNSMQDPSGFAYVVLSTREQLPPVVSHALSTKRDYNHESIRRGKARVCDV